MSPAAPCASSAASPWATTTSWRALSDPPTTRLEFQRHVTLFQLRLREEMFECPGLAGEIGCATCPESEVARPQVGDRSRSRLAIRSRKPKWRSRQTGIGIPAACWPGSGIGPRREITSVLIATMLPRPPRLRVPTLAPLTVFVTLVPLLFKSSSLRAGQASSSAPHPA
jgi:hypothetical protein